MKKTLLIYLLLILPALFLFSCSEESSELEALESANIHQPGVMDSTSANFHGKFFIQKNMKFTDCQKCHGKDLDGGITKARDCKVCHSLATIHINLTGIQDTASANFHGKYLLQHSFADCGQCHGKSLTGGSSSPSCTECHEAISVHKTNLLDPASADFHGKFLMANGWNISTCASCHGNSFTGGTQSPTCATATCHNSAQGPAACNTCHGDFNNPSQISPPRDLSGNSSTSFTGVGAHVNHLSAVANGTQLACSECHTVPSDVNTSGHLGSDGKAEINFGAFTNKLGGSSYDFGTNKCANTYCHGNFEFKKSDASSASQSQYTADKMVGNKRAPQWNLIDGSEVKCSSCHGKSDADPSPIGHIPYTIDQCVWCHSSVIDGSGAIIDKTKHINGKANAFGTKLRK